MNPIEILIDVSNHLELKSGAYALRPIFGRINANIVSAASRLLRTNEPVEAGGVDAFNELISRADADRESISALESMGLTPRLEPRQQIRLLAGLKSEIKHDSELSDIVLDALDDLPSTIAYMATPRPVISTGFEALAQSLNIPVSMIVSALETEAQRNAQELRRNRDGIIAVVREIEPQAVGNFDDLDSKLKASLYTGVDGVLAKQLTYALTTLARGGEAMGSIPIIREAQLSLKAWARSASAGDPDLALALVA